MPKKYRRNPAIVWQSGNNIICSTGKFSTSTAKAIGNIMGEILFTMFLTCTIIIAFNLFALESNALFSIQTVIAICDVACLLPSNFTYCFLAEKVTADLLKTGDVLFSSAWYRLPVAQQKLLVVPLQVAECEYRIKGLRLINCSLAVFLSVSCPTNSNNHIARLTLFRKTLLFLQSPITQMIIFITAYKRCSLVICQIIASA